MKNQLALNRAIMLFNHRVLDMGHIVEDFDDDDDIMEKLKFNAIFKSNSDELFEKYSVVTIIAEYLKDLETFNRNVADIIDEMPVEAMNFEGRLSAFRILADGLVATHVTLDMIEDGIDWRSGEIYYLNYLNGEIIITTAAQGSAIYDHPIKYRDVDDDIISWRTEDAIIDYLSDTFGPTVAIRPTMDYFTGKITRLEFHGELTILPIDMKWLSEKTIVIENDYLYIGDLQQVLKILVNEETDDEKENRYLPKFFRSDAEEDDDDDDDAWPEDDDEEPGDEDDDEGDGEGETDGEEEIEWDDNLNPFNLDDILGKDMMMEYPNDTFDSYLTFLRLASIDPRVKQISICLYRFGDNPIIFYLLRESVRRGIRVIVNVETNARNESINRFWIKELTAIGAIVLNGGVGNHKVHAKLTSVVFHDGTMIAQIGTGNYHWKTTTQYNDLSYFTADRDTCTSVEAVFDLMQNGEVASDKLGDRLIVSGINANRKLVELIESQARLGYDGYIVIKANSFDGNTVISEALDRAADAGCLIELIIRGACTWVPARLNERVAIKSVVGEELEHARVYQFGQGNLARVFIGSLDPIARKLDHRLEVMVEIIDRDIVDSAQNYLRDYTEDSIGNIWYMVSDKGSINYECRERN